MSQLPLSTRVDGPAEDPEQVLLQYLADGFYVVGCECRFIPEPLGDVTLGAMDHYRELGAAHPMARHGNANFVTDGACKRAGFRLFP